MGKKNSSNILDDITTYAERFGLDALGYALKDMIEKNEIILTDANTESLWEYGGNKIELNPMPKIESWWRHLGCYDREQASGLPYEPENASTYLDYTDNWWKRQSDEQKKEIFTTFFTGE